MQHLALLIRTQFFVLAAALSGAAACGDASENSEEALQTDAGTRLNGETSKPKRPGKKPDSGTTPPRPNAADCCPISDEPSCCLMYGGSRSEQGGCGSTCDGMPSPDADWKRGVDKDGCEVWIEPEPRDENDCCGCFPEVETVDCEGFCGNLLSCHQNPNSEDGCDGESEDAGCSAKPWADEICPWIDELDETRCVAACEESVEADDGAPACVRCLLENFSCTDSAALRGCDAVCEGTIYTVGDGFEAPMSYDMAQYYCAEEDLVSVP